jgi:hypothetical protein
VFLQQSNYPLVRQIIGLNFHGLHLALTKFSAA